MDLKGCRPSKNEGDDVEGNIEESKMQRATLGESKVDVSRICLGVMGFGVPNEQHPWTVDYETSLAVVDKAIESGITFFDTAFGYNNGTSEEYLGRALRACAANRASVQIATKCVPPSADTRAQGYSDSQWVRHCLETSLERLGEDYVDLYICHWWQSDCDMQAVFETMSAFVDEGKARALGVSNMFAWQIAEYNASVPQSGLHRIDSVQGHYNLINREEEREMIPYCRTHDIALTPYSSLAGGRLTRLPEDQLSSKRGRLDKIGAAKYGSTEAVDRPIIMRVHELAKKHDVSMTTIALAWELQKTTSPVVGVTKPERIPDIVAAFDVSLSSEEIAYLEQPYVPHRLVGVMEQVQHSMRAQIEQSR